MSKQAPTKTKNKKEELHPCSREVKRPQHQLAACRLVEPLSVGNPIKIQYADCLCAPRSSQAPGSPQAKWECHKILGRRQGAFQVGSSPASRVPKAPSRFTKRFRTCRAEPKCQERFVVLTHQRSSYSVQFQRMSGPSRLRPSWQLEIVTASHPLLATRPCEEHTRDCKMPAPKKTKQTHNSRPQSATYIFLTQTMTLAECCSLQGEIQC